MRRTLQTLTPAALPFAASIRRLLRGNHICRSVDLAKVLSCSSPRTNRSEGEGSAGATRIRAARGGVVRDSGGR